MQEQEFKRLLEAALAEQQKLHNNHADTETLRTLNLILTSFGIEEDDRVELKKDFQHLRRWRVSYETVERAGWKAVVTVLVTGFCGLVWLGLKSKLGFLGIGG